VAGFKVATDPAGIAMYGAIYADDCLDSPAGVSAKRYPLLGIEGEIAYRFTADLPARDAPYDRAELERVLVAFPAIEIVDSRFESYADTPMLDRLADRMSNGAMVLGRADGAAPDFAAIRVVLRLDGEVVLDQVGGHSRRDPFLPVVEFIRSVQARRGFAAGQFITAGTFTGLVFGAPGQHYTVEFVGFGMVSAALVD
jgi:2-keto-4-pentenoate hydratase